jgi:CoA:oxalate CoA-transferase
MKQPLNGIKVIDLTSALAGPYCSMLLGDMGAEVLKIEEAKAGDMLRKQGPFIMGGRSVFSVRESKLKSLRLNLKEDKGRDILIKLVKDADIMVDNFRPQVKYRLKIDYPTLKEINPPFNLL